MIIIIIMIIMIIMITIVVMIMIIIMIIPSSESDWWSSCSQSSSLWSSRSLSLSARWWSYPHQNQIDAFFARRPSSLFPPPSPACFYKYKHIEYEFFEIVNKYQRNVRRRKNLQIPENYAKKYKKYLQTNAWELCGEIQKVFVNIYLSIVRRNTKTN